MGNYFKGKAILITGGIGTIGFVLAKALLKEEISVLRLLDVDETRIAIARDELKSEKTRFLIGDIRDKERMIRACEGIDIVFHTAALKHVLECEYNSFEAVKTNITGTQNMIDACLENNVEKMIFTSSDKAVNPAGILGASKLVGEKMVTNANFYKGKRRTAFSSVRFGNVLGSRGSIISVIEKQLEKEGQITVTDPKMTRFVMSEKEAVELLLRSTEYAVGGEVFVFKMPAVLISDLLDVLVDELSKRKKIDREKIGSRIIGVKPGEKLYEELMSESETESAVDDGRMFIILPRLWGDWADYGLNFKKYDKLQKAGLAGGYASNSQKKMNKEQIRTFLLGGVLSPSSE